MESFRASGSRSPEVELSCDPPKFAQPGMAFWRYPVPVGTPLHCHITAATSPFNFFVVPYEIQKPYLRAMRKFHLDYNTMTPAALEEAEASPEFLNQTQGMIIAVFYKGLWHRGKYIGISEEASMHKVVLMDKGEICQVHICSIRRLYFKYLGLWPGLAVRCSFRDNPHAEFLLTDIASYARFFVSIVSENPNCQIIFKKWSRSSENVHYWDVQVLIMRWRRTPIPQELVGATDYNEESYNMLFQLRQAHEAKEAAGNGAVIEDFYHYF